MTVVVFSGGGTGGHLYPALAIADALTRLRPDVEPHFVGARRGIEARVLPERGLPHTLLTVEGLSRTRPLRNVRVLLHLGRATLALVGAFRKMRPAAVVLTGGYASAPAGLAGAALGLPIVVQEQNEQPGLTTKLMARWAAQIHLAYPEAATRLPPKARAVARNTGNPIRPPTDLTQTEARAAFDLPDDGPVVLVVGGSQGSAALNALLTEVVLEDRIGKTVRVLWATGPAHFEAVLDRLAGADTARVHIVPYIDDMSSALAAADLAVSRAGAMTTSELLAWGVPALLIPLPTAAEDHQTRNALALEAAGVALHLPEEGLTGAALWAKAAELLADPDSLADMKRRALERARPHGARDLAAAVSRLLPPLQEAAG